jgi:hypothetical protein
MGKHFLIGAFAVAGIETSLHLNRIASPVQLGGLRIKGPRLPFHILRIKRCSGS